MTVINQSRLVAYSCEQMFDIVLNVQLYSEFLPHCSESLVHHRDEDEMQATLVIAAAGMTKSFTTRNRHQMNKMIEIRLVDGPFSHLEGFWRFDEEQEGCRISFDLEFEFSSRMLSMVLSPVFEQVTEKMVEAFCKRAIDLYG